MTAIAVLMMVVAITIVWGGLVASIVALRLLTPPSYVEGTSEAATADSEE